MIPKSYKLTIYTREGQLVEELDIISHRLLETGKNLLEIVTTNEEIYLIPLNNIFIKFDKNLIRLVEHGQRVNKTKKA